MIKRLILTGAFSLILPFVGFAQYAPSSTPAVENTTTTNFTADVNFAGEVAGATFVGDGSALTGIAGTGPIINTTTTNLTLKTRFTSGIDCAGALVMSGGTIITLGSYGTLDLNFPLFIDAAGNASYDWEVRTLYADEAAPTASLDYANGILKDDPTAFDVWEVEGTANDTTEIVNYQTMTNHLATEFFIGGYQIESGTHSAAGLVKTNTFSLAKEKGPIVTATLKGNIGELAAIEVLTETASLFTYQIRVSTGIVATAHTINWHSVNDTAGP